MWIKLYLALQSSNHQCFIEPRVSLPPNLCPLNTLSIEWGQGVGGVWLNQQWPTLGWKGGGVVHRCSHILLLVLCAWNILPYCKLSFQIELEKKEKEGLFLFDVFLSIHILKFWERLGKFFSKVQTLGVKTLTAKLHSSLEGSKWGCHGGIRLTPKEHHVGGTVVCHWLLGTEVATPHSGDGEGIDCDHVG